MWYTGYMAYVPAEHMVKDENGDYRSKHYKPVRWDEHIEDVFLETLEKCGVVTTACRVIGFSRNAMYRKFKQHPLLWQKVIEAREVYRDKLRQEINDRAFNGTPDMVVYQGQIMKDEVTGEPLKVFRMNDNLLIRLADAQLPEFKQKQQLPVGDLTVNILVNGQGKHRELAESENKPVDVAGHVEE